MDKYKVTGMSCAACQARVEKAVCKLEGVDEVNVNLLTNSMTVEGTIDSKDIIKAVKDAGYGAKLINDKSDTDDEYGLNSYQLETKKIKKRLLASIGFLLILMYFSMGHTMFHFKVPKAFADSPAALGILQMVLASIVMIINRKFFINGFKGILHKSPNMDTLVALGSSASFIYSVAILIQVIIKQNNNHVHEAHDLIHDFYFESAAMILTLITVGKMLESISKGRTTNALKGLMNLAPKTALIIKDDEEVIVPIKDVKVDDIFIVKAGEAIPVDGQVIEGYASLDESALTGESIPVDKTIDSNVYSGTTNTSGFIKCKATNVGKDTTLSKIIQMVSDASASKAPIAKIADKVSAIFVPCVIVIAIITYVTWSLAGYSIGFSLSRAISVLVISCPCALGLATPVAIMVGSGVGAKHGILFKTATSLEQMGRTNIIALDKTGTITNGTPVVTDVIETSVSKNELIEYAYSIESYSEHPLAKAICDYAAKNNIEKKELASFITEVGNGLSAKDGANEIHAGKLTYVEAFAPISEDIKNKIKELSAEGKTPLFFTLNNTLLGVILVADTIKNDSAKAISTLNALDIDCIMLTGDNEETARNIAIKSNIKHVISGVLPADKEEHIKELKERYNYVTMVGDGINDAPALTRADIGIAIGAGTDIAIDAADVVLMKNSLYDVSKAIVLSRKTLTNIKENLFWAFIYNIIGIPLAAGVYYPAFGLKLNPMFGAAAMSLSSFCVVTNALRLNLLNLDKTTHKYNSNNMNPNDIIIENSSYNANDKGDMLMKKKINIKGMMCEHCEASVKKSLLSIEGVTDASVSHVEGNAIVSLSSDISNDILKKAIEDKDYEVLSIEE